MENINSTQKLIHNLDSSGQNTLSYPKFFSILLIIILAGGIVGFILGKTAKSSVVTGQKSDNKKVEKTAGIADKKTFKDKAEGKLKEGGVDGEGNFHLERPGGESQNVYLTSTTVDLSQYVGKKIRVWGETFQAEKAGWLMDVGFVEILN